MLRVDIEKQLGDFSLHASFSSEGRVIGLFGASGAGKTSLVNMIAGLLRPDRGTIVIDGETVDDTAAGIHVPTYRRRIGYVFQDARLFPHLSVAQNLDYGRRMNGLAFDPAQHKRIIDLLDIGALQDRRPGKLSGGERQRVALGRALLSKPRLLLLDEPLGALDALTRIEMQQLIESLWRQHGFTAVLVTHDVSEAVALADRVLLVEDQTVALDEAVPLARPRQRGQPGFAALEDRVLHRVLQRPDHVGVDHSAPVDWPALARSGGLRWAV